GAGAITLGRLLDPGSLSPLIIPAAVSMPARRSGILRVIGGSVLDQGGVRALCRVAGGAAAEVIVDGRTVSSSLRMPIPLPARTGGIFRLAKGFRATFTSIGLPVGGTANDGIVAIASLRGDVATLQNVILFVLVGSVLVVSLLSFGLARAVSEPIRRLADQASAALAEAPVLAGVKDPPVERTADEVTTLASTLSV